MLQKLMDRNRHWRELSVPTNALMLNCQPSTSILPLGEGKIINVFRGYHIQSHIVDFVN